MSSLLARVSTPPLVLLALGLAACDGASEPMRNGPAPDAGVQDPDAAGANDVGATEDGSNPGQGPSTGLPPGAVVVDTPADAFAEVAGRDFRQPLLVCVDPLPGEPPGAFDGKVCTWSLISACTEEGRRFIDYSSCEEVVTQRPYAPFPAADPSTDNDPRLADETWVAEQAWVASQVESCACVCCHSTVAAPQGPSGWYIEAGPLWVDTIPDDGLAMLAGLVPSDAFGAFHPDENNGFDRRSTGLPTTDVDRMSRFFLEEYLRRGGTPERATRIPPFGGPLAAQRTFVPEPCTGNRGFAADGSLQLGGRARYVYLLEEGSENPGVPPNLDLPDGTLWRLDVPRGGRPLTGPLVYGEVPEGMVQRWPAGGEAPPPLVSGTTYYLYAWIDIGLPLARCLTTAP